MKMGAKRYLGERGTSLLETMVAGAIGLVVIAGALDVFLMNHRNFLAQKTKAELQQDTRGGGNLIAAELRLASPIILMGTQEVTFKANVNGIYGTTTTAAVQGQLSLLVTPNHGWVRGKTVLFCSVSRCEEHTLARNGTSGHLTLVDPLNNDFPPGSCVEVINEVRYYLSHGHPGNAKVMREVDHGANPLIEHVKEFSFAYRQGNGQPANRVEDVSLIRISLKITGNDGHGGELIRNHTQDIGVRAL
jgi:hypothetical protein